MPIARVSRLTIDGFLSAGKRARISRLTVSGTAAAGTTKRARISRLGFVGNKSSYRARISRLQLVGAQAIPLVPVLAAAATRVEPGATASVSTEGTTGNAVAVTFSVASGGVSLSGTGTTRTFIAPRDPQGRSVVVQADYTDAEGATATRTVTVTVYPQQFWFLRADLTLLPVRNPFRRI